jgi:hypothetical protein
MLTIFLVNLLLTLIRATIFTCFDVNTTIRPVTDIPFCLISGNRLCLAASIPYKLDIAPPVNKRRQGNEEYIDIIDMLMLPFRNTFWSE